MYDYESSTKVLIENYRNFEIRFDTEEETFYSVSDYYDTEIKKKTFAATKTAIDNYIKENTEFRAFYVADCKQKSWGNQFPTSSEDNKIKITGIRKDKRFVSDTKQISDFDEQYMFLIVPENEVVFEELKPYLDEKVRLEKLVKANNDKISEIAKKLKLVNLRDYRKTLFAK